MELPDRRRSDTADGPQWLYSPAGVLRVPWRLALFAGVLWVSLQVVPIVVAPLVTWISGPVGQPLYAIAWIMLGAVVLALTVVLRFIDRAPWTAIGCGRNTWRAAPLWKGWVLGSTVIAITAVLLGALGYLRFRTVSAPMVDGAEATFWYAWFTTALRLLIVLAPAALWEELVFRGYLWTVAEDAAGNGVALWSTSIAFGLVHLFNPGAGVRTTMLVVLAGMCLGLLRVHYGLPAAWLAHLAWNWVMAAVLHVPVSGIEFATPGYRGDVVGPSWLTGGDWGPEGGLLAALVLSGALLLAQRKVARRWSDRMFRPRTAAGVSNIGSPTQRS